MKKYRRFAVVFCLSSWLVPLQLAYPQSSQVEDLTGNPKRGAHLYRRYCAGCHGEEGNGEGENARHLDPRPRDFTTAVYKCRSTPTESLPSDEDLFSTIEHNVHANAMPA